MTLVPRAAGVHQGGTKHHAAPPENSLRQHCESHHPRAESPSSGHSMSLQGVRQQGRLRKELPLHPHAWKFRCPSGGQQTLVRGCAGQCAHPGPVGQEAPRDSRLRNSRIQRCPVLILRLPGRGAWWGHGLRMAPHQPGADTLLSGSEVCRQSGSQEGMNSETGKAHSSGWEGLSALGLREAPQNPA